MSVTIEERKRVIKLLWRAIRKAPFGSEDLTGDGKRIQRAADEEGITYDAWIQRAYRNEEAKTATCGSGYLRFQIAGAHYSLVKSPLVLLDFLHRFKRTFPQSRCAKDCKTGRPQETKPPYVWMTTENLLPPKVKWEQLRAQQITVAA